MWIKQAAAPVTNALKVKISNANTWHLKSRSLVARTLYNDYLLTDVFDETLGHFAAIFMVIFQDILRQNQQNWNVKLKCEVEV